MYMFLILRFNRLLLAAVFFVTYEAAKRLAGCDAHAAPFALGGFMAAAVAEFVT